MQYLECTKSKSKLIFGLRNDGIFVSVDLILFIFISCYSHHILHFNFQRFYPLEVEE